MEVLGFPARRLGNGLVAFGAVGLLLTTVMTIAWLGGLLAIRDLDERLEADRQSTAAALADAAALMATSSSALRSSADSLGSVGATLHDTARMLDSLSSATADLADALDVTILGQQPFASLAVSFDDLSVDVDRAARDTRLLVTEVGQVRPDLQSAAIDLRAVEASVSALAIRVSDFEGVEDLVGLVRGYGLLSALISAWLAALAAGCVWAGRQLQRAGIASAPGPPPPAEGNPTQYRHGADHDPDPAAGHEAARHDHVEALENPDRPRDGYQDPDDRQADRTHSRMVDSWPFRTARPASEPFPPLPPRFVSSAHGVVVRPVARTPSEREPDGFQLIVGGPG